LFSSLRRKTGAFHLKITSRKGFMQNNSNITGKKYPVNEKKNFPVFLSKVNFKKEYNLK
jgi:hypothetical protein